MTNQDQANPRKIHVPFSNLTTEGWKRLAFVTIFAFYAVQFIFALTSSALLVSVGSDFLAFWSAGKIANELGYSHIYDIQSLAAVQADALTHQGSVVGQFIVFPCALFSFFVLPF